MSNSYRLDIQVGSDSAEAALKGLREVLDELEQSSNRASDNIDKFSDNADSASKSAQKLTNESKKASNAQKDLAASFKEVAAVAAVGFAAISGTVALSIGKANEFESALAGISKVVDFKSPDGLKDMRAELEALSTQIPLTFTELAQITAAGGQLGVAEENLIAFTRLTADMATAFDMSAESAGDSMAKLANIFSKPIEEMSEFGDMINTVSNNMPAKASEIVESLTRIGGTAKAFGLVEKEAVALTSAMISLGKAPEVASTAINSMLTTLSTLDVADKDVAASLKAMGLNAQEFGKTIREDGYKAIMQLLEGIEQLPKDQKIGIVTDLFGKNFGDDIVQLAGAPDVLEKINGLLAEQQGYIGSMAQEAQNVSSTSEARNKMFLSSLENASAALGEVFKPALDSVRDAVIPVLGAFADFTKENPTFVAAIVGIAGAFTGVLTILGGILAVLPILASGWAILTAGATVAVAPILGVVAAIAAVVAAGALLYDNWDLIKAKGQEIWASVSDYASQAWQSIQQTWQGIGEWFSNIWNGVKTAVNQTWQDIVNTTNGYWQAINQTISGISLESIWQGVQSFVSGMISELDRFFLEIIPGLWQSFRENIINMFSDAPEPVQEMVNNIFSIFDAYVSLVVQGWELIITTASFVWNSVAAIVETVTTTITDTWNNTVIAIIAIWEFLKASAASLWDGIVNTAQSVADSVVSAWQSSVSAVSAVWDSIVEIARTVWNDVQTTVSDAIEAIKPIIESVSSFVSSAWDGIVSIAQGVWDGVVKIVGVAIEGIKAVIMAGVTIFASIFNAGFNTIKNVFVTAFSAIKALVRGDMQGVKDAISQGLQNALQISKKLVIDITNAFKTLGKDLIQTGRDAIQGLINGMGEKIGAAVSKAKEVASSIKNTVTNFLDIRSPSRVMKQIGEWVSEGLAIGIAYKAPLAAKAAKNLAQTVKDALESDMEKAARSVFLTKQKIVGNPYAELTTDIAFGKYGSQNTSKLLEYKQEEARQANILKAVEDLHNIKKQMATLGMDTLELMEWEYQQTDETLRINRELFDTYKAMTGELIRRKQVYEAGKEFENTLKDIDKQLALIGDKNPLAEFFYDLEHSSKYAGYTVEQLGELKDAMIELQNAKDTDALKQSSARAFSDLNQEVFGNTPADQLRLEYAEKLTVIDEFEQMHTDRVAEATRLRGEVERQHEQAMRDLRTAQYQEHLSAVSGLMKSIFGEQSKAYRLMFAASKAFALAEAGMNVYTAASDAYAKHPGTVWQKIWAATKATMDQGKLVALINAINPKGFRSGGYTGNMGVNQVAGVVHGKEYVLNASATKRIGKETLDKLNQGGSIGGTVVNVNVTVNSDGTSNVQASAEQGRAMGYAIKAAVLDVLRREKQQGGLLYG